MERPIGVIDSGVGGLTVLHELKRQLPKEQFIYLGDTLRCPYGSKKEEEVIQFTWEIVKYLMNFDMKMLIVACNTATALVLDQLKAHLPFPVIGVIEPGARAAIKATRSNHVAIIGTSNTIHSRAYEIALKQIKPDIQTLGLACPDFVPMIENGQFIGEDAKRIVENSLQNIRNHPFIDTLILGCTHYPIIQPLIEEVVGPKVTVLSSADETGIEVSTILTYNKMHAIDRNSQADPVILTTGSLQMFYRLQEEFFHFQNIKMKHITLT